MPIIPTNPPSRSGQRLGTYTLGALLGAGGMGEVYRARDARLDRDVAIKLLPVALAADPDRRTRFENEARVLAALNHPHIGAIHGVEDGGGLFGIVLELVEGETLAERIAAKGRLPVAEALALAAQLADALDTAHERGIVHRDLKPANLKFSLTGALKVLDFGLARVAADDHEETVAATRAGAVFGTAAYMSPEQARGQAADARTDVWAFGCVLFEMLTGARAFRGDSGADTIAAVLNTQPDWKALPAETPSRVRLLLRRCLEKDLRRRLRSIADARLELEGVAPDEHTSREPSRELPLPARRIVVAALAVAVVSSAGWLGTRFGSRPAPAARVAFQIGPPEGTTWGRVPVEPHPIVSPDGQRLAFVGRSRAGRRLWIRDVGAVAAREIAATQDVTNPFWSSDGRKIAYCVAGRIKKIDVAGRPPEEIASGCVGDGDWRASGDIVFTGADGLFLIAEAGGMARRVTMVAGADTSHLYPRWMPGGRHVMFLLKSTDEKTRGIYVVAADGGPPTRVVADESMGIPVGAADGTLHFVFVRGTTLVEQRLDAATFAPAAEPIVLADPVALGTTVRRGAYSASPRMLVYRVDATFAPTRLQWFDRSGRQSDGIDPGNAYVGGFVLSPDETTIAFGRFNRDTNAFGVWLADRSRGITRPLFAPPYSIEPGAWSGDGRTIAAASNESGFYRAVTLTMTGQVTPVPTEGLAIFRATDLTPDGKFIAGTVTTLDRNSVWIVPSDGSGPPRRLAEDGTHPAISPDGRWVAYVSAATGTDEVYVQRLLDGSMKTRVSTAGGFDARWRGDGRELFFASSAGDIMSVAITTEPSIEIGTPELLFRAQLRLDLEIGYVVTKDGQHFLVNVPTTSPPPLVAIMNWLDHPTGAR